MNGENELVVPDVEEISLFDGLPKDVIARLSPTKLRCMYLYLSGTHTLKKIATIIKTSPRTVSKYLRDPDIQLVMKIIQERDGKRIEAGINSLRDKALETMSDLMNSEMDNVRFQAAKDILDRSGHKAKNTVEVNKTVTNIEKQLSNLSNI